jgi:hypothetical protein
MAKEKELQDMKVVVELMKKNDNLPRCSTFHELKTTKLYFGDMWDNRKKSSVRLNDRKYKKGDVVLFRERSHSNYTGREILAVVTHVLKSFPGIQKGYAVLSFAIQRRKYEACIVKQPKKRKR